LFSHVGSGCFAKKTDKTSLLSRKIVNMPKRKNKTKKSHQVPSNNTKHASSHFPTELTDDQPSHTLSDSGRDGGGQGVGRRRDRPTTRPDESQK